MPTQYIKSVKSKIPVIHFYTFSKIEELLKWVKSSRYKNLDKRAYPVKIIQVDFSRCRPTIKPYHITPLACLIHEYQSHGYIVKIINIPESIRVYLESFNFGQFCRNGSSYDIPGSTDSKILPLWQIARNTFNLYPHRAEQFFESNHFDGVSLFSLSVSLAELMNNIFDHSESSIPGYTFTQYNSKQKTIITCVCDFGVGIPTKINNYLEQTIHSKISNADALRKAFEPRFSTKTRPHNRGCGLDTVLSNVRVLNSKALIISNNAVYRVLPDNQEATYLLKENFQGTLFVIWLNTDNLPVKEEEITEVISL